MSHRLFSLVSAASSLLFAMVLVLWIGSHVRPISNPNQFLDVSKTVRSSRGWVYLTIRSEMESARLQLPATFSDGGIGPNVAIYAHAPKYCAGIQWQTGYATSGPVDLQAGQFTPRFWRSIAIPYAYLATITGAMPFGWGAGSLRRHLRRKLGLCPNCRQDLRHSTTCCPKCGEPICSASK